MAIMLGRLGMTIDDCIGVFKQVFETIYEDVSGRFSSLTRRLWRKPKPNPIFEAERLEKLIETLLESRGVDPNALLNDSEYIQCKVYVI